MVTFGTAGTGGVSIGGGFTVPAGGHSPSYAPGGVVIQPAPGVAADQPEVQLLVSLLTVLVQEQQTARSQAGAGAAAIGGGGSQLDQVVALVNVARAQAGVGPVERDARLDGVAAGHAQQMAAMSTMAHDGIGDGDPNSRVVAAIPNARRTAENVAVGQRSAEQVVREWMASPGHRRNILDPALSRIGVALSVGRDGRPYWAQNYSG